MHHSDQMYEGSQAQKVTIFVQYSKVAVSQSVTKGRYRAVRAAKKQRKLQKQKVKLMSQLWRSALLASSASA